MKPRQTFHLILPVFLLCPGLGLGTSTPASTPSRDKDLNIGIDRKKDGSLEVVEKYRACGEKKLRILSATYPAKLERGEGKGRESLTYEAGILLGGRGYYTVKRSKSHECFAYDELRIVGYFRKGDCWERRTLSFEHVASGCAKGSARSLVFLPDAGLIVHLPGREIAHNKAGRELYEPEHVVYGLKDLKKRKSLSKKEWTTLMVPGKTRDALQWMRKNKDRPEW